MEKEDNGVLVDTSIWIEFFKPHSEMGDNLEKLIKEDSVWACGIVLFELVQGTKTGEEKNKILGILSDLKYVEMSPLLWQKAGELSASLKKKGINLPLSDIFIAILAIEHDLQIFTLDKHFEEIPGVKVYKG